MKPVAVACVALFMITSLIVGLRVLGRWQKTRKLPELLLAIALLSVGFFSFAVGTLGKLLIEANEPTKRALTILGLSIECVGVLALTAFAWRVFHPEKKWALSVALLLASAVGAAFLGELSSGEYFRYADSQLISGPYVPLGLAARGAGPAWMALECFRYYGMLKRRARLGLAEPFVVHRVLLWGIAIGASALAYITSIAHRLIYGTGLREHEWAVSMVAGFALVSAVGIALAFTPPRKYRVWVEGNSDV